MAETTRYNGNANGVVNVDRALGGELNGVPAPVAKLISTGIGKHPTVIKCTAATDLSAELGTGGKVETALRTIQLQATTIAYQVNTTQLAVLVEATGWVDDAALLAALGTGFTAVDSVAGLVLA